MSNTHKVATDALATLGTIIDESAGRDAIHLAVEPMIAGERLYPGQHIGINGGKAYNNTDKARAACDKHIGIVDPFLSAPVEIGARFWLIVYPRQITSLRHVWEHPDFKSIDVIKEPTDPVEISQRWINEFADKIRQHPKALMDAADNWLENEDYTYDNSESYKDHWNEFPEFWKHYEIVTGRKPSTPESFFTCSC